MAECKVQFEVYESPLDLLLYLVRKQEVDIYQVSLARFSRRIHPIHRANAGMGHPSRLVCGGERVDLASDENAYPSFCGVDFFAASKPAGTPQIIAVVSAGNFRQALDREPIPINLGL